ncbi:helix-turn-helix transcriptional regulator [Paenibacillus sp. SYP-B4298]|uniref:helix-turn-helix transcriptional regulator n=1 Tax=Paenibacillus sp. SYP-B4298 TaxID=2996034 RepID=UPI0022DCFA5B|nr:helix-turn-helix domain-containing protein [Paenibacillus sp. SYP-B4298]
MIKNGTAYEKAQQRLRKVEAERAAEIRRLQLLGIDERQTAEKLEPLNRVCEELAMDIRYYEEIKRGVFPPLQRLTELGRHLIAYRIFIHMSQAELAARLGVSESQVSRDERNEYYGATVGKLEAVMTAMGIQTAIRMEHTRLAGAVHDEPTAGLAELVLLGGMKDEGHSNR